ncbi:hypothetical protein BX600DRAFT_551173 [Xylariales sp. PMI_506]|nr:hypothetical protein BX600DRAFT_551173 [Xylariales sp. PMI_506]
MDFVRNFLNCVESLIKSKPIASATVASLIPLLAVAYQDYRAYVALGPHGLPDNWYGWYWQLRMTPKARKDTTVPVPYDMAAVAAANGPNSRTSYLETGASGNLKPRAGPRPEVCGFVAPQRQLSQQGSERLKAEMNAYLDELVRSNSLVFQRENSTLEGPVPAVQLREGSLVPPFLEGTKGELIHVHPPDGSTHLVLSLADSARVIETGWGQRHRLSGSLLTWGYTLVYAPRSTEELAVWKRIVGAAARFASAQIADITLPPVE